MSEEIFCFSSHFAKISNLQNNHAAKGESQLGEKPPWEGKTRLA